MNEVQITPNQQGQADFLNDWNPGWLLLQGGLGCGKTFAGARKSLLLHAHNRCPGLVVAPTYGDLFRFCVAELKSACNEFGWPCEIQAKGRGAIPFPHMIVWGEIIYLLSAEDPKRFAGFEVGWLWADEGARYKQNFINPLMDAPTQIRSRLRHPSAKILQAIVTGTPEGTESWLQANWIEKPLPNHRIYYGETAKNTALPTQYIDDLKESLPSHLLDQYLKGIAAELSIGLAHPTFSDDNISDKAEWVNTDVHICQDFNVSPMAWCAVQDVGTHIHVVDEIFIEDFALVDNAMELIRIKEWHLKGGGRIIFHPDKSSKNRKTTGDPEFTVVKDKAREFRWNFSGTDQGANPGINQSINNLSRMICNGIGYRKLLVNPRCTHLIDDFRKTTRKNDGYEPGPKRMRGHILDALKGGIWDIDAPVPQVSVGRLPQ